MVNEIKEPCLRPIGAYAPEGTVNPEPVNAYLI